MDVTAASRRMLGTVGWQNPRWNRDYYPEDLPDDWRLAYYANDCDCVLLPPDAWCDLADGPLTAALREAPEHLVFFLQCPHGVSLASDCPNLALFPPGNAVLLVERPQAAVDGLAQWVAQGDHIWVDPQRGDRLVRWAVERMDLRELRSRAQGLDDQVRALVVEGPDVDPSAIRELRTLLDLLGLG